MRLAASLDGALVASTAQAATTPSAGGWQYAKGGRSQAQLEATFKGAAHASTGSDEINWQEAGTYGAGDYAFDAKLAFSSHGPQRVELNLKDALQDGCCKQMFELEGRYGKSKDSGPDGLSEIRAWVLLKTNTHIAYIGLGETCMVDNSRLKSASAGGL